MTDRQKRDLDHALNAFHGVTRALIAGDEAEAMRCMASARWWTNEVIDDGCIVHCALRWAEEVAA